jgi:hypothetical protein
MKQVLYHHVIVVVQQWFTVADFVDAMIAKMPILNCLERTIAEHGKTWKSTLA